MEGAAEQSGEMPAGCVESTYGEIRAAGVARVLAAAGAGPGDVVVDFGSGVGRMVLQAALQFNASAAVGVELAPERHASACGALRLLAAAIEPLSDGVGAGARRRVTFVRGDITTAAVGAAAPTVAFLNSLCFRPGLMVAMEARLLRDLPEGATVR